MKTYDYKSKDTFIMGEKIIKLFHKKDTDFDDFILGEIYMIDGVQYIVRDKKWNQGFCTENTFSVVVEEYFGLYCDKEILDDCFKEAKMRLNLCKIKEIIHNRLEQEEFEFSDNSEFVGQYSKNIIDSLEHLKKYGLISKYKFSLDSKDVDIKIVENRTIPYITVTIDLDKGDINEKN